MFCSCRYSKFLSLAEKKKSYSRFTLDEVSKIWKQLQKKKKKVHPNTAVWATKIKAKSKSHYFLILYV